MADRVSKAILITGCSTGIGRTAALRLASRGHNVYASARKLSAISDLAVAGCKTLELDVCDEASMRAAVGQIEAAEGAVGALVNNAGYGQGGAIEEVSMEAARQQFETNVFGLLRLTQLVLPGMRRQRWGRVVNVSSMGGKLVFPGLGVYHATKFAVEAMSDALRFEVRGFGIRVSVIEPGAIRTQFEETSAASMGAAEGGEASPYSDFYASMEKRTRGTYAGPMAAGPEIVARAIEHAVTSSRPRSRYPLTAGARLLLTTRRMLPDGGWDALMAMQFARPG
jgi:NAD(P)-dependent dehydrogenase (short-subunit alcohol dehydrogenase family)